MSSSTTKCKSELLPSVTIADAGVGCVDLMTKDNGDNLGFFVRMLD